MANKKNQPAKQSVAVLVYDEATNCLLLGKRGDGKLKNLLAAPSGSVEKFDASPLDAAIREFREETGHRINRKHLVLVGTYVSKRPFSKGPRMQVYRLYAYAVPAGCKIKNCEPGKCKGWKWIPIHELPRLNLVPGQRDGVQFFVNGLQESTRKLAA